MNTYHDYSDYNNNEHAARGRGRNWLGWVVGLVAVVMLLIIGIPYLAGQANSPDFMDSINGVNGAQEPQGGGPPTPANGTGENGLQIRNIIENPEDFIGRNVTLRGEVDDVISPNVLRMDQEGTILGDEILVVTRTPISQEVENSIFEDDYEMQVTGSVRRMTVVEIERDLLGLDLNPDVETEIEDRDELVIVVDSVRINTSPNNGQD